jgi:polyhydroxyalkanoate synthesis repressor PhaR
MLIEALQTLLLKAEGNPMIQPRLIKKYPNRRLYDSAERQYITLDDVRKLVVDRIEFQVIENRSGADITHGILLQVILEQELAAPLLSRECLLKTIRTHEDALRAGTTRDPGFTAVEVVPGDKVRALVARKR